MFDKDLAIEILQRVSYSCQLIEKRFSQITNSDDFLKDENGLEKLDSICMQLIAIGESLKNFDKISDHKIFCNYPEFEWKKAKGMRDIISHHYFDLNSEIVFEVCLNQIPILNKTIQKILDTEFHKSP